MDDKTSLVTLAFSFDILCVFLIDRWGFKGVAASVLLYSAALKEGKLPLPDGKSQSEYSEHVLTLQNLSDSHLALVESTMMVVISVNFGYVALYQRSKWYLFTSLACWALFAWSTDRDFALRLLYMIYLFCIPTYVPSYIARRCLIFLGKEKWVR